MDAEARKRHADYMRDFYRNKETPEAREVRRQKSKVYYQRNRAKVIERSRKWQKAHKGHRRHYLRLYTKENRAKLNIQMNEAWHRRRARILTNGPVDDIAVDVLAERDRHRCGLCSGKVYRKTASIDHIIPLSRGGSHTWENVQLAHLACNRERNNSGPAQMRLLGETQAEYAI